MNTHRYLYIFSLTIFILWSALAVISGRIGIAKERRKTIELAKKEAIITYNKDQAFRLWGTEHGGVYVPVSQGTPPNPYLSHVPERDITTPSGRRLTLMNPAYMMRQVMDHYQKFYGTKGHLTSLNTLNPINKPDEWESSALAALENERAEEILLVDLAGGSQASLRILRPMYTQKGCLKCHGIQGYKVGDLRGGVSVTVPLGSYLALEQQSVRNIKRSHFLLWLFGSVLLGFFTLWGKGKITRQIEFNTRLTKANADLQQALEEIKTLRGVIPICAYCNKIRDDNGVWSRLEEYIGRHSEAQFSHSACPQCYRKQLEEIDKM